MYGGGLVDGAHLVLGPDSDHILPGPLITGEVALFASTRPSGRSTDRRIFVAAAATVEEVQEKQHKRQQQCREQDEVVDVVYRCGDGGPPSSLTGGNHTPKPKRNSGYYA